MQEDDPAIIFDRKTIQRDVKYLRFDLHAPIDYDGSQQGYFLSDPNWSGFATFLEKEEMEAAALGAHVASALLPQSTVRTTLRQGADGLWAQNSTEDEHSYAVMQSLVISGGFAQIDPEVFQVIFEQWRSHHTVIITYLDDRQRRRKYPIEPHAIMLQDNQWYVRARTVGSKPKFYTLALRRIQSAERDGRLFEPDYVEIGNISQGNLFDLPRVAGAKLELLGLARKLVNGVLPIETSEEGPNGTLVVTLKEVEEYRILNFVLTANGGANILSPDDLKKKACSAANNILATLQGGLPQ